MRLELLLLLAFPASAADFLFTAVTINGAGPFHLLVDTGASSTSLSPEAARRAGLAPAYAVRLATLAGETLVPAALASSVAHAQTAVSAVEILIASPGAVRSVDAKADGVLGQSFLSRVPWMIDYASRRFVTGEAAIALSRPLPEFACERTPDSRLVLPLAIGKAAYRVALDSGASHLVLHCGGECPRLDASDPSRRILTNTGAAPAALGRVREVAVGPLALNSAHAVVIASPAPASSTHGVVPASWFSVVFADPRTATLRLAK